MLKESPPSPSMMGYSSPLSGFLLEGTSNKSRVSSFHHSDSSWDFDFDSFSDVPVYDEATTPTTTTPTTTNRTRITTTTTKKTSCYVQKLPWEEDTKKKKKKKDDPRELDFNSSWPSARHLLAKTTTTSSSSKSNKTTKSKASKNKCNNRGNSNSLDSNSNHGPASPSAPSGNDSRPAPARSRGVRFAPTKVVRTHTLVLGDHPMCEDGLALQLGWDFTESRDIIKPLSNANGGWNLPRWRRILRPTAPLGMEGPAKLLSLQERRKLLKEVAGCTDDELEKRCFCARYLSSDYAFRKPKPSAPKKELPKIPASNTGSNKKSFTNMKNFAAGSSNSTTTTTNNNNSNRGSSNGCRDPPPTPTSQQVRAGNETPIARPRRRSLNRRTSQPHYAARMA